eukprot:XP_016871904.1 tudor domain-containing protein 1 isoform X6 [Homo sapiens]
MSVKSPFNVMSRNNLEAPPCKMTEPFNFEKNENKLPPHESLRSPGTLPNHPNFRLKSSENGNKKNNFLLCEQTKQYLASQEDNSVSSNPNGINGEVVGSKGDRKKLPAGNSVSPPSAESNSPPKEVNIKPGNNVRPAKSKKLNKLVENSLSISNPGLFTSLGPPLRSTTCHRCGLFGSLRCSQCKQTYYCSTACQRRDWSAHSIVCRPVQPNFHKLENKSSIETKDVEVNNKSDCPLGVTKEIAIWAERIMFSDLRSLQLKKTMEIKGTVTEFKHPGDFYVQLYSSEVLEYMNQLSASLKETYANVHEKDYIPVKGEVCIAKYTVDQAIKCFVANVIPAEGNWSSDCIKATKPLLMEQYCSIKIVDILEEEVVTFAVEVELPNSGKLLDHVLIEMGYGLKPSGQDSKKENADQSDPEDVGKMTTENNIVVDKSDLIPKVLTLNVGDEFCGVVAHIQTPEDFFCQQLQSGRKLAELQASLSKYCDQLPPRSDFYPAIGDICCAQFSGVKPSLGIWTPEAICLMKKLVQNKIITVKVVDKLENSSLVELIDKSETPHVSVSKVLLDAGFAVGEQSMVTDKPSDVKETSVPLGVEGKVNPLEWTWVELGVDQTVDVVVCVIYSPGEFYCHVLKEDALKKLNDLNKSLAEHCQQKLPNGFKAEIGQPCCAFFAGDGSWYRALVKEILPNGHVKVHFVDYGNIEEVTADELRMISSTFLNLPFQGIRCQLADIQSRNKHWSEEAITRFQMCVAGIKLQARVVEVTENGIGVELTDLSTCYPRIISDVLIDEHLVLKSASPHKDLPNDRLVNKHELQVHVQGLQATSSAEQWKTIELPVDKTIQANVLEIISPNLFYALPKGMPENQEKLCMLTAELLEYCNAPKSRPPYRPRIGDACCAKYTSDDFWYRAVVLGTSDTDVEVLYADYGNIETLPLCRVQPITSSHLALPFQIIRCSLEEKMYRMNCCCTELQKQVEKHEHILLFLLNNSTNQNKFIEMKKLLKS